MAVRSDSYSPPRGDECRQFGTATSISVGLAAHADRLAAALSIPPAFSAVTVATAPVEKLLDRMARPASLQETRTTWVTSTALPRAVLVAGLVAVGVIPTCSGHRSDSGYPTRPDDIGEQTAAGDRVEADATVNTDS